MKNLSLLLWITQLGLSVAVPPAAFVLLAVWAQRRWDLGVWIVFLGVGLGIYCAVDGFRQSLKVLSQMSRDDKQEKPPVSFNDHD